MPKTKFYKMKDDETVRSTLGELPDGATPADRPEAPRPTLARSPLGFVIEVEGAHVEIDGSPVLGDGFELLDDEESAEYFDRQTPDPSPKEGNS